MSTTAALALPSSQEEGSPQARLKRLAEAVEHAAHLLPEQGPITVFIHHNTLHAFEELPFEQGVRRGAEVFGCRAFLPERRYRDELRKGRIRFADLRAVLREDLGKRADESVLKLAPRLELRLAMLQYPIRTGTAEELRWLIAESDALLRVRREASGMTRARLVADTRHWFMRDLRGARDRPGAVGTLLRRFNESTVEEWSEGRWEAFTLEALWGVCHAGVRDLPALAPPPGPTRHRDLVLAATGVDTDAWVNDLVIRYCAPSSTGVALAVAGPRAGLPPVVLRPVPPAGRAAGRSGCGLEAELARVQDGAWSAGRVGRRVARRHRRHRGRVGRLPGPDAAGARGWAGMVQQVEVRDDRVAHPSRRAAWSSTWRCG
ncbi:MAG: putative inorganic carbon transporter subunit DabA [Gemmataceae bacterium]